MGKSYLMLAANQNHLNAQYELALFFYEKNDLDQAVHYFTLAANNGDRVSKCYLGLIFADKNYPKYDGKKAASYILECYRTQNINNIDPKIIKINENYTNYLRGVLLYKGEITPRNINESIYYLKLAANNNYPDAKFLLGNIYSEGKYIQKDIPKAIFFFQLAGKQDFSEANYALGCIFHDIQKNKTKAIHYFKLAA